MKHATVIAGYNFSSLGSNLIFLRIFKGQIFNVSASLLAEE